MKKKEIKIRRNYSKINRNELNWEKSELEQIRKRIAVLRPDQIGALTFLVGVKFYNHDIDKVTAEIRENKHNSVNIDAIIFEADSKENLLWWIEYFEKHNK